MNESAAIINIKPKEMQDRFMSILSKVGFTKERSLECAKIFTSNSVDGIYTHGVNRFPRFVQYIKDGFIKPDAVPSLINNYGSLELWNGNLGPGPLNAVHATNTAINLAEHHGIGCVALSNTNHWMRGGTYGWQAAKKGFVFIGFTNTVANMPAWGAVDARLGNNPLVIAMPYKDEAIVLDMAMSQYSFGSMELSAMKNQLLPVSGGFNKNGELTNDPAAILESGRPLPIGYWKGAGLALLLDLLAAIISGGQATHEITRSEVEYGLSQVFIVIDISRLGNTSAITNTIENIINDYHQSIAIHDKNKIVYPGEGVIQTRKHNLTNGMQVMKKVWDEILLL